MPFSMPCWMTTLKSSCSLAVATSPLVSTTGAAIPGMDRWRCASSLVVVLGLMSALVLVVACGSDRTTTIAGLSGDTGSGEALFGVHCASCHGADRAGTAAGPDIRNEVDEAGEVIDIILTGEDTMPAFADALSDQEIADILTFLQG